MTVLTFGYSAVEVAWEVPAGVTSLTVDCVGARGGDEVNAGTPHGKGARVQCDLSVTPGETLWLYVGGHGTPNGAGFNGGGTPGTGAGGGGGASDVRQGGATLADRVIVAGGGGGAGANNASGSSGAGGDAGTTGTAGTVGFSGGNNGGGGATGSAGGAGGTGSTNGSAGALGTGGAGAPGSGNRGGGGGGGGLYGGGGGAANGISTSGGGGGGGSSLSTGVSSTITAGYNDGGDGYIVVTFTESAHAAATAPCLGDRFDRADSTTALGTADTGQSWVARKKFVQSTEVVTALDSVLGIINDHAYDPSGTADDRVSVYTIDHGFADLDASLVVVTPLQIGEQANLVYRWADDSHFWRLMLYRSIVSPFPYGFIVRLLIGSGSFADLGNVSLGSTPTFPITMRILAVAGRHRAYANGSLEIDATTSAPNDSATNHGIALGVYNVNAPVGRVDDYRACPVGLAAPLQLRRRPDDSVTGSPMLPRFHGTPQRSPTLGSRW